MTITPAGYLLVPICVVLFFMGRSYLFKSSVLCIALIRVIVLKFPGYSMNLPTLLVVLLAFRHLMEILKSGQLRINVEKTILLLFLLTALISIFMPLTFAKGALVNPHQPIHGSGGETWEAYPRDLREVPLEFTSTNVTQFLYLVFFGVVFWVMCREIKTRVDILETCRLVIIGGLIQFSSGIMMVVASFLSGLSFVEYLLAFVNFFNPTLNPGWYERFGMPAYGTWTGEAGPSTYFLVFPVALILTSLLYNNDVFFSYFWSCFFLVLFILAIVIGGTTGYISMILLLVHFLLLSFRVSLMAVTRGLLYVSISVILVLASSIVFLGYEIGVIWEYILADHVATLQGAGGSGHVRLLYAWKSLDLALQYPLFGVGWGSNRAPSLLPVMISNLGFIGTTFFFLLNGIIYIKNINIHISSLGRLDVLLSFSFTSLLFSFLIAGALARPVALLHNYLWYPLLLAMMSQLASITGISDFQSS